MDDLEESSLSKQEKRVLNALASFVHTHQPGASLSAIDGIVLSYIVGILEDITSDDEFDVDSFVEMIGSYIPGFESIEVALVCEWVFALSSQLPSEDAETLTEEPPCPDSEHEMSPSAETVLPKNCQGESSHTQINCNDASNANWCDPEKVSQPSSECDVNEDTLSNQEEDLIEQDNNQRGTIEQFTSDNTDHCQRILEVVPNASLDEVRESLLESSGDLQQAVEILMDRMVLRESNQPQKKEDSKVERFPDNQVVFVTKSKRPEQKRKKHRRSKNGKENHSSLPEGEIVDRPVSKSSIKSSQISDKEVNKDGVQHLMELFPAASSLDAQQCLAITRGDLEGAAQLLMERINSGEIQQKPVYPKFQKPRAVDEKKQRELLLQKYAFVDTEEEKKNHQPFLPKPGKKKMVRYYDSKPVTMKGERFFEVKDS